MKQSIPVFLHQTWDCFEGFFTHPIYSMQYDSFAAIVGTNHHPKSATKKKSRIARSLEKSQVNISKEGPEICLGLMLE